MINNQIYVNSNLQKRTYSYGMTVDTISKTPHSSTCVITRYPKSTENLENRESLIYIAALSPSPLTL